MCMKCQDGIIRKPVVFYKTDQRVNVVKGWPAFVVPINHPSNLVSNTKYVRTSKVVNVFPNGVFETLNTIYKPEEML